MKIFFVLLVAFSFSLFQVSGQKTPPESVKNEFAKKYPSAQSVKWASEEANEWEAEFKNNGQEMSASFDNKGTWLESETEINEKDLPEAVTNTLKSKFAGFKAGEISVLENPQMKGYEIALKKGETNLEVVIDKSGKEIIENQVKKGK